MRLPNLFDRTLKLGFILAIPYISNANAEWWTDDSVTNGLIVSANTLMVMDWAQTRYIADHPENFREGGSMRRFIGENPTSGKTNKYFAGTIIINNAIGMMLPKKYKKTFYGVLNVVYLSTTTNNKSIGVKIKF